ncbi:15756_t:CDS:2 [Funneliformis geosporum]|uniref:17347_t:CDS:1 n=1 Tax=Funneliformis geosporum TaxID=1117311 RepID=A0A9W4WP46_9GLOM|nr:15756_t:CDS:2 [Funneliformis geosporum]CAI2176491.1 17347_t:CDS:2 [Funneliformis geosporum]
MYCYKFLSESIDSLVQFYNEHLHLNGNINDEFNNIISNIDDDDGIIEPIVISNQIENDLQKANNDFIQKFSKSRNEPLIEETLLQNTQIPLTNITNINTINSNNISEFFENSNLKSSKTNMFYETSLNILEWTDQNTIEIKFIS